MYLMRFHCVYSVSVLFDGFMITHIDVMISSISPTGDIGEKILPNHTARFLKDGNIFHPSFQARESFATS